MSFISIPSKVIYILVATSSVIPATKGDKWWEAASMKVRRSENTPTPVTSSKSTPGPPVPATVATTGGRCTCQCEAPKIVRVEVPKIQIKYIPVVIKNKEEEVVQPAPPKSYQQQQVMNGNEEVAPQPMEMTVTQKQVTEETIEEEDPADSYQHSQRTNRYGLSYLG